jgi:hypothetical protein
MLMPLPEAQIVVQFSGGVETKKDRKGVLPSKMLSLENAVFSKAISFVKRNGYEDLGSVVLGSATPLPTPLALGRRGFELLAFTGTEAYSFIDDASAWVKAGDVQSVICDHEAVAKTGSDQTLADMAELAGVALYAWEDSRGGVWYAVIDDYTGRALVPPTQVDAGGERPRCHAVGAFLHLYWVRSAANEVRVWRIEPSNPTAAPVETILLTNIDGNLPLYDVDQDDEKAVIAWRNTDAQIQVGYVHQTGAIGGAGLGLPIPVTVASDPTLCLSVALDKTDADRRVAVAWANTSKRHVMLGDDLVAEFAIRSTADLDGGGAAARMTCVFLGPDSAAGHRQLWIVYESATHVRALLVDSNPAGGFVLQAARGQRGLVLGSKAFIDDGDAYVHTQRDSTLYRTYYTQRVFDGLAVARFLPGLAGGTLAKAHLPSVSDELGTEGRSARFAAIYVTDVESPAGDVFTEAGVRRVSLDFLSPDAFRSVQLGKTMYIAGGLVQAYDGERVQEAGFHYGPDDLQVPVLGAPTTGPGLADGTYGYVACYENVLANGEVERGPTSPAVLVEVTGGPRRVTVTLPTYRWPSKPGARIAVFRSEDGDAAVFSRVSSFNPSTVGQVNGFVANNPNEDTVTFIDEMDDETLIGQEPLYTNGGIPANDPIGAARLIAGGKGRVFTVDSSEPNRIYFSQEQDGIFAAELSPDLFLDVDPFGGDINGLVVMDDALIAFKETAIFLIEGAGPLANPAVGGGFAQPQLVTSDVGCFSPDSLGYTPVGVMFQSQKGIYQLGRDRAVVYTGAAVEAFNLQRVVACTLIENKTQIRFLTDEGRSLLYDYQAIGPDGFGQWSTFTNHEGQDAILVDGAYFYLRNDGRVFLETEGVYRDNNSQIRMAMETAWLNLAGHLQGWQFLWWVTVVGEFKSDHLLRVFVAFDYEEGWSGPPIIIDPAEARVVSPYGAGPYGAGPYGGINDTRYQFQIHVGQECESVRFRFEDVEPTDEFGASFELSELHLTGGVQRSSYGVEDARVY